MTEPTETPPTITEVNPLTPRQLETLRLMAIGLTNQQIAEHLTGKPVTMDAAKMNVKLVMQRLGAQNRADAVGLGYEHGLLDVEDIARLRKDLGSTAEPSSDPEPDLDED
jgi:DNA-binding NarL/FixJ family response regulator